MANKTNDLTPKQLHFCRAVASGCTMGMWAAAGNASQKNPAKYSGVLFDNVKNCTLKNLEIKNFCNGVAIGKGMNNTVVNCAIHDNGGVAGSTHGVHLAMTHHNTITENNISYNLGSGTKKDCGSGGSGNGIFLFGGEPWGNWNKFIHNELTNNTKAGYYSKYKCANNIISHNNATRNGLAGIILRAMSTYNASVYNNTASDNSGVGIYIRGNQSRFWNNTICNNTNDSKFYPGLLPPEGYGCGGTCDDCGVVSAGQVAESGGCGVVMESGPGLHRNYLQVNNSLVGNNMGGNNTICYNGDWDIYDKSNPAGQNMLIGDDNKCNAAFQYKETDAGNLFPCDKRCGGAGVDIIVLDVRGVWTDATRTTYNVSYTVANAGTVASVQFSVAIYIDGVLRDTQIVLPPPSTAGLGPGAVYTAWSGTYTASIHNITIKADSGNVVVNENEDNNCRSVTFGGPDFVVDFLMTNWVAGDASLKNFSMNYKIKNIGDSDAEDVNVKFCFCNLTHCTIGPCTTVIIADLDAGDDHSGTVGQFKLPDPMSSYIKCMVDCSAAKSSPISENNEHNNFQHVQHPGACYSDCGPCAGGPGGCGECLDGGCGDVNCDGTPRAMDDAGDIISGAAPCLWAADLDCDKVVGMSDAGHIISGAAMTMTCCPGMCP